MYPADNVQEEVLGIEDRLKGLCIIDRFEDNGWAVVEFEGRVTFDFPRSLLPEGAKEGDVLRFHVEVDQAETAARWRQVEEMTRGMFVENDLPATKPGDES